MRSSNYFSVHLTCFVQSVSRWHSVNSKVDLSHYLCWKQYGYPIAIFKNVGTLAPSYAESPLRAFVATAPFLARSSGRSSASSWIHSHDTCSLSVLIGCFFWETISIADNIYHVTFLSIIVTFLINEYLTLQNKPQTRNDLVSVRTKKGGNFSTHVS